MKNLALFALTCLLLSSCVKDIKDGGVEYFHIIETENSFLVFEGDSKNYKEIYKPVSLDTLKTLNVDLIAIKAAQEKSGMVRFVDGNENSVYDVNKDSTILLFLFIIVCLVLTASIVVWLIDL